MKKGYHSQPVKIFPLSVLVGKSKVIPTTNFGKHYKILGTRRSISRQKAHSS